MLGVDYGEKRIGLALSDPMKVIASPLKTVLANRSRAKAEQGLLEEIAKHDLETIVIGLPLHLSNRESTLSLAVRNLKTALETQVSTPIVLWDERLTSKQIHRAMIEGGVKRKKRSTCVDVLSATLILQSYLDCLIARSNDLSRRFSPHKPQLS